MVESFGPHAIFFLGRGSAVSHPTLVDSVVLVFAETFAANVTLQEPERETVKVSIVTPMALTSKDSIGDDPSCSSSPVKV